MSTIQTNLWAIQTTLLGLRSAMSAGSGTGTEAALQVALTDLSRLAEPAAGAHPVLADISRIAANGRTLSVGDLDDILERLRGSLHPAAGAEPLPWNGPVKQFLMRVWPNEIALPMRLIQDVPEFLLRAHKVMRHVHRAELLENIRKSLAGLEDRALAAELLAELEPSGKLAGIFARGGDRVAHVALRELVAFAGRAAGAIGSGSNPPASPVLREWNGPKPANKILPDADAVAEAVAACLESTAALESDLESLKDVSDRTTAQLRGIARQLEKTVSDLEGTVSSGLPAMTEDVVRLLEILPEEIVEGAQSAGERLPQLLEDTQMAFLLVSETLAEREREEEELRESGRITETLDAQLEGLEERAQAIIPLLAAAAEASGEAERLVEQASLTAARFAEAHLRIAESLKALEKAGLALKKQIAEDRGFLEEIPKVRRTGAIADRIDAYEVQAEGLANLVNSYESRLAAAFAPFAEREASLTLSPPAAAVPAPPSFASRRFQAGPDTPRSVLELLASVDPRQHATVNLMPEIALFARDEDVYASLLKLLHLRRRYGTRGTYVNYLENGRFRDGYAPNFTPRSAQGNSREIVRFVDDAGEEHSLPSSEFRMAVALERVNPAQMEKEVRSTDATYHFYKIKYYTALLGIDPEMTDRYVALFEQHHLLAGSPLFPTLRLQFLAAHFLDDDVRGMLMKRLSASVPAVSIRRRLEGAGEAASLMKIPLELLARQDGKELSADEMNAFLYLYGFQSLLADQPPEERHRMKAEILGNAIEELAPDLRYTGGVRQPLDSWTVREGIIGADAAREKFRHAVVLSTPDSSHLLLDRGNARVAERFLKTRVPERALKDVFGSTVDLPAGGAGYRLVSPEEYGNWYAELIRRLELLSEKPTPASDSVFYVLTASDPREAAELRPELLGILLEDAENRSVTRETLLDRVALWMMHNSDRFHPMRTFRDLSKQWKKHLGPASRRP